MTTTYTPIPKPHYGPWFAPCPVCRHQIDHIEAQLPKRPIVVPDLITAYEDRRPVLIMIPCGHRWKGGVDVDVNTLILTWHDAVSQA